MSPSVRDPFVLDPRLEADSVPIGRFALCLARLIRDARYPWVLLVPARAGLREIYELDARDRALLIDESTAVASSMARVFAADKMNVAALGNVVPQLHVHHIARFASDDAWPSPVWGAHPPLAYEADALEARIALLRETFVAIEGFVADGD